MGSGFNLSIYFMLGVIASIFGGFGFLVWSSFRKAARLAAEGQAESRAAEAGPSGQPTASATDVPTTAS